MGSWRGVGVMGRGSLRVSLPIGPWASNFLPPEGQRRRQSFLVPLLDPPLLWPSFGAR